VAVRQRAPAAATARARTACPGSALRSRGGRQHLGNTKSRILRPSQYAAAETGTSHNRTRRAILPARLGLMLSPTGVSLLPASHVPDPGAQGPTGHQETGVALRSERGQR